jgi:hypothetical protein
MLLGALAALAQVSNLSTLRGTVTDQSGALVPEVKISIVDQATGQRGIACRRQRRKPS